MKMLYIFLVDTGHMISVDMKLALESVGQLKSEIAKHHGIPEDKQVLLISGGESLNPNDRVCSYSAGTDTNPIFLFSKSAIESAEPPYPCVDYGDDCDMKEQVEGCLNMPPTYHTVVSRAQLAQHFYDLAKNQRVSCERLVYDQHLQQQGWAAVVANLEDIASSFKNKVAHFESNFLQYLESRNYYVELLKSFSHDISTLSKIPVLPVLLRKQAETHLGSGEGISLLQWISSKFIVNIIIHEDLQAAIKKNSSGHRLTSVHKQNQKTNAKKLYERHLTGGKSEYMATLDEAYIYLDYCNGTQKILYVQPGQEVPEECLVKCHERWSEGFMIVGEMMSRGTLLLIRVSKTVKVNTNYYMENILKPYLKCEIPKLYPGEEAKVTLHHDKASSHTARYIIAYLQKLKTNGGPNHIPAEDIPTKAPDILMDFFGFGFLKQRLFLCKTLDGHWKIDKNTFDNLHVEIQKALEAVDNSQMKEVKGLGERLMGLETLMCSAKRHETEQGDLAQAFHNNQNQAGKLGDPSILPDLCISHQRQLEMLLINHQNLRDIRRRCARAKKELSENLHSRLRWIMFVEKTICDVENRLMMYHDILKRLKKYLEVVEQIHLAPKVYLTAVAEVVRRRNFSRLFVQVCQKLYFLCCLNLLFQEISNKSADIWPSIQNLVQPPALFDANLPNIEMEDIEKLRQLLPELANYLKIPLQSDMPTIFLNSNQSIVGGDVSLSRVLQTGSVTSPTFLEPLPQLIEAQELAAGDCFLEIDKEILSLASEASPSSESFECTDNEVLKLQMKSPIRKKRDDDSEDKVTQPNDTAREKETFSPIEEEHGGDSDTEEFEQVGDLPKDHSPSDLIKVGMHAGEESSMQARFQEEENENKSLGSHNGKMMLLTRTYSDGDLHLPASHSMISPECCTSNSQEFFSADFFIDESMPSSYTESNGTTRGSQKMKSHHVLIAELQRQLEDKASTLISVQRDLDMNKSHLERVQDTMTSLQSIAWEISNQLKLDILQLRDQIIQGKEIFIEETANITMQLNSSLEKIQKQITSEKDQAIEEALERVKQEHESMMRHYQSQLELESQKLEDAQTQVEMYYNQVQYYSTLLDNTKLENESQLIQVSYSVFSDPSFVIFKTMDKEEFCVLIKHCFLMEKNTVEAKQWLDKNYGDSAPGKSSIIDCIWIIIFQRDLDMNKSHLERVQDTMTSLQSIAWEISNQLKLDILQLRDQIIQGKEIFIEETANITMQLNSSLEKIQKQITSEKDQAIEEALERVKQEHESMMRHYQSQLELESQKLEDAQTQVEMYYNQVQYYSTLLDNTKLENESQLIQIKKELKEESNEIAKNLMLEHELELDNLREEWNRKLISKEETIKNLNEIIEKKDNEIHLLHNDKASLERVYTERFQQEREQFQKLMEERYREQENVAVCQALKRQEELHKEEFQRLQMQKEEFERQLEMKIIKSFEDNYEEKLQRYKEQLDKDYEEQLLIKQKQFEHEKQEALNKLQETLERTHKNEIESLRSRFKLAYSTTAMEHSSSESCLEKMQLESDSMQYNKCTMKKDPCIIKETRRQSGDNLPYLQEEMPMLEKIDITEMNQLLSDVIQREKEAVKEKEILEIKVAELHQKLMEMENKEISSKSAILKEESGVEDHTYELKMKLQKKETELEEMKQKLANYDAAINPQVPISTDKVSVLTCEIGDVVLLCFDEKHDNYMVFYLGPVLHFLHTECLETLGFKNVSDENRRSWALAEVIEKEYCLAKKPHNRYKVPVGTRFYRVKAKPWDKEMAIRRQHQRRSSSAGSRGAPVLDSPHSSASSGDAGYTGSSSSSTMSASVI
ncbi:RB1-inducible coiled-coil protein 1-like [Centruroides sculpturatus]|uniref:RB1-inducible coiled-coil protein 1-like n=1 Tax=Centruroides sculpturatus TaxID=218467 RepID=UPI000C6D710D|nr:RB1-inducible coiled-coil protein 1-like [Centruroides sculpturatus]